MKQELVISTMNEEKFKEIKRLFKNSKIKILSLKRFSNVPRIIEDGNSFNENAVKKALVVSGYTKRLVLADDSGLEVFSLKGEPGAYSARYAGPKKNDRLNCLKLLRVLKGKPISNRKGRFKCVAAVSDKGKLIKTLEGSCEGRIGFKMEGDSGFGYDPVFIPNGYKKSFAQLGPKIKDKLSHRAKALKKAKEVIEVYLSKAL